MLVCTACFTHTYSTKTLLALASDRIQIFSVLLGVCPHLLQQFHGESECQHQARSLARLSIYACKRCSLGALLLVGMLERDVARSRHWEVFHR